MDHEDTEDAAKRFYASAAKVADLSENATLKTDQPSTELCAALLVLREDLARFRHCLQATGQHA